MHLSIPILGLATLGYANAFEAVIVAVGASITYGLKSPDGNGYRGNLKNMLSSENNTIQMVGTVESGTMHEGFSEGYPGHVIHYVGEKISENWSKLQNKPNIVVTLVGTNDCNPSPTNPEVNNTAEAPDRYDYYLGRYQTLCPECVVVAAALPPNANAQWNSNIDAFNAGIKAKVQARADAGQHILFMDNHLDLSDIGKDGTHPTGQGYEILGDHFRDLINSAHDQGWITTPMNVVP